MDLDYSRPLKLWPAVDHWAFHDLVRRLLRECYGEEPPGAALPNLRVLLANLYSIWCDDPELSLAIPMSNSGYSKKTRYNRQDVSAFMIKVVDRLYAIGKIEKAVGFFDRQRRTGKRTRIWPVGELRAELSKLERLYAKTTFAPRAECIVLRDEAGKDIEYLDNDHTNKMRQVLVDYNALLQRTFIDIPDLDTPKISMGNDSFLSISQTDKFVRRVFNRGSWRKGGRFYGGWWQRCPKEWRKRIFINDHPTIEDDYSGLHIVMLYGWKGIDYWETVPPDEDPYELDLPELDLERTRLRQCAKTLMLIAINAESETSAFNAFRSGFLADGDLELGRLKNKQLATVLSSLREKHRPIAEFLGAGAGIDLMNQDSQVTEFIIKRFCRSRQTLAEHTRQLHRYLWR